MEKEILLEIIKEISKDLQTNLNTSQKDWDEKREKAYIVGYLQSTIDFAIIRLNSLVKN